MLTSCKLTGAAGAISAYHSKEENYYFSQGADVGDGGAEAAKAKDHIRIHGELCKTLGLKSGGGLSQDQFSNLLSGRDASGDRPGHGADRPPGASRSRRRDRAVPDRSP